MGLTPNVLDEAYFTNLQQQQQQQNQQNHHSQNHLQLQRALQDAQMYDLRQRQEQQQRNDFAFQRLLLAEQAIAMPYRAYEQQLLRQLQRETANPVMLGAMAASNAMGSSNNMSASAMGSTGIGTSGMGSSVIGAPNATGQVVMGSLGSSGIGASGMGAPGMGSSTMGSSAMGVAAMGASGMVSSSMRSSAMGSSAMGSPAMGSSAMGSSSMGSSAMGSPAMKSPAMGSSAMGPSSNGPSAVGRLTLGSSTMTVSPATKVPSQSTMLQGTDTVIPKLPAKRKSSIGKVTASPARIKKVSHTNKPKRPKVAAMGPPPGALGVLVGAVGLIEQHDEVMSSISTLLKASQEVDDTDALAYDLVTAFAKVKPEDVEDEDQSEETEEGLVIDTPFFRSKVPEWPRTKPYYEFSIRRKTSEPIRSTQLPIHNDVAPLVDDNNNIDPWWPSVNAIKRERRNDGINVDEDDFVDSLSANDAPFRVNETEVRNRLANQIEPGVLEKLPHCRIHLLRSLQQNQNNGAKPDFAFCVQVTDLYPNDPMVHCSSCGTWRHTKCGGRCTPSSGAVDRDARLSTICDLCYAETSYVNESQIGTELLQRQRMEHARRSLATSAVIRHFSHSKNAGTYKWPMGSVSSNHIAGHIRSVQVRYEKAEKQWADMTSRLARSLGFRARDRVKNRQREFERLLSSLEDAEAFTDRHNMFLFLMRDIMKVTPAGFENEERNMLDPADDENAGEMPDDLYHGKGSCECARQGCSKLQRFDSRFCSDACGVACLESDLLRTLQDAGELHPSSLRTVV